MSRMNRRSPVSLPVSAADERLHAGPAFGWPVFSWASSSVTVTASATPHAAGAWTEVVASATEAVDWLVVALTGTAAAATDTAALLDLAVGASGSEVAVVSSLPAGHASGTSAATRQNVVHVFPLNVAAGTRIAARMQALISADTVSVVIVGYRAAPRYRSPRTLDTLGAVTASSRGTNMPSSNTYVEVTAATTQPYSALIALPAAAGATSMSIESSTYTVAVGASGSEIDIGSTVIGVTPSETIGRNDYDLFGVLPGPIPAGTRIACKQSIGRNYRDVIILGVPVS